MDCYGMESGLTHSMKLLFVHHYFGALGGAEADLLLTATILQARGHSTDLVFVSRTGKSEETWREAFPAAAQLPESGGTRVLEENLEKFAPDLVYLHSLRDLGLLQFLVESGVPVVRRVHDHGLYCMRGYKYNYFTRRVCHRPTGLRCLFPCLAFAGHNNDGRFPVEWVSYSAKQKELRLTRQCRHFVVYSQYQKEELEHNGFDPEKIDLYVPISCNERADSPCSSFGERNLVMFAGQLIRGKGVDLLLKALAKIRLPFECLIFGEGSHRAFCERLCRRLRLQKRVQFRGFAPKDVLRTHFLQASVLAISSVWPEPFALVGQEAMRYGLPVVAFDAGGIGEWLLDGENGFLVPWMDTTAMAARIEQLLTDKDLARRLGRRGMELVNGRYEATRQVEGLEKIFQRVIGESQVSVSEVTTI